MQFTKTKDGYLATLSPGDVALFDRVVDSLLPYANFDELGQYRTMTAEEFWSKLVGQVCVMGLAKLWEKAKTDIDTIALLRFDTVRTKKDPETYLAEILKAKSATRFHPNAAKKLAISVGNKDFFASGKLVAFDSLPHDLGADAVRNALMDRSKHFGMKTASNFMITTGLSDDVLALDSRIAGFLNRHCKLKPKASWLQSNPAGYRAVEQALREYVKQKGISLAKLVRTLFQFTTRSVVDFIASKPGLKMKLRTV